MTDSVILLLNYSRGRDRRPFTTGHPTHVVDKSKDPFINTSVLDYVHSPSSVGFSTESLRSSGGKLREDNDDKMGSVITTK